MKKIFVLNSKSHLKKQAIKEMPVNFPKTPINKFTFLGAKKRAQILKDNTDSSSNSIFVGLESGLVLRFGIWFEECWCCLVFKNKCYYGYSSGFPLPKKLIKKMKEKPHWAILEELSKKNNFLSKDTWRHYSSGKLSRLESLKEAFRNGLLSLMTENGIISNSNLAGSK